MASRKAPLCNEKPCSWMGRVVSHVDAPGSWASVTACLREMGSCVWINLAAVEWRELLFLRTDDFACS